MGNVANGAKTPKSISKAADKVAQLAKQSAESAVRDYNVNKLGVRAELDEFFRVTKIVESDNSEYVIVHLKEGSKKHSLDAFKVTVPVKVSELDDTYVGTTYLKKGMTIDDVDEDGYVTLGSLEGQIGNDKLDQPYYVYGFQVLRYFVTEKPTEKWSAVNIVDDAGKILHEGVYLKKRLVRADGSAVE